MHNWSHRLLPWFAALMIAAASAAQAQQSTAPPNALQGLAALKRQIQHCHLSEPPEGIPANEARVATLDYEGQCYRQLAEIEHAKLNALRDGMFKNHAHKVPDQKLLQGERLPQCHLSKAPEGIPANEARVATLDYESQCYRQLAEIEFGKLDALQEATREMATSPYVNRIRDSRSTRFQLFMTHFQATR